VLSFHCCLSYFDPQPKKQEKKSIAPNAAASQDIFNAHDFDIDINVAEMGVSIETPLCFSLLSCLAGLDDAIKHSPKAGDDQHPRQHRPHQALPEDRGVEKEERNHIGSYTLASDYFATYFLL